MFSDPFCLSFPFVVRGFLVGLETTALLGSGSGDGIVEGAGYGAANAGLSSINSLSFASRSNKASCKEIGAGIVSRKGFKSYARSISIEGFYKPARHINS